MGILEALGCGLPCLVTEGTGFGDIINSNYAGYSCEGTSSSVADMIKTAIANYDERNFQAENARALVELHYDWKRIAQRSIEKYKVYM